jgi:hypothetical protein
MLARGRVSSHEVAKMIDRTKSAPASSVPIQNRLTEGDSASQVGTN